MLRAGQGGVPLYSQDTDKKGKVTRPTTAEMQTETKAEMEPNKDESLAGGESVKSRDI